MTKEELRQLADKLLEGEPQEVEDCIRFFETESFGVWHGRARAMMARRLKHRTLTQDQRARLLNAVLRRLESGLFSEQFRDQLRLALHLDRTRTLASARSCLSSSRLHVRKLASWVLQHE